MGRGLDARHTLRDHAQWRPCLRRHVAMLMRSFRGCGPEDRSKLPTSAHVSVRRGTHGHRSPALLLGEEQCGLLSIIEPCTPLLDDACGGHGRLTSAHCLPE